MLLKRYAWPVSVLLLVLPLAGRALLFQGWLRPVFVSGPSMAPTLWPASRATECSGCGIALRHFSTNATIHPIRCYNCGTANSESSLPSVPPDRVLIDRGAYIFGNPKRMDLVAIESSNGELAVKRVLGLPGESIDFVNGDLLVDGVAHQQSLPEVLERAIDVCDDRYRHNRTSQWMSESDLWIQTDKGFTAQASSSSSGWLVYHHQMVHQNNQPGRVRDDYPGNQGVKRVMVPATDLILQFRCEANAACEIDVALAVGAKSVHSTEHRIHVSPGTSQRLTVAHLDGQFWAGSDDSYRQVARTESKSRSPVNWSHPIGIRCSCDTDVRISELVVRRDIVWWQRQPEIDPVAQADHRLGSDEFFVVGDNVPRSSDSRQDLEGPFRHQIVGRVYPYPFQNLRDQQASIKD